MNSLLPLTSDLIRAFGWTLLHSFWQACFVFACLRIVLWLWPQANAGVKYHLSFLSLAGIAGWFLATFYAQLSALREAHQLQLVIDQMDPAVILAHAVPQGPAPSGLQLMMPGMESYFPFIVALYVIGVTIMTIKLCIDLAQLSQMRQQGLTAMGNEWNKYLDQLAARLGVTKKVQLYIGAHLQVPVMIGFLRPVILLPAAMVSNLSSEQLEAILLHELAHIKRNDYLLNIFQSIVETFLFFNPFVWWISKNIRREREHCCDDLVIAGTVQPMHYAKALVALEEYRLTVNPMAMAAARDKHLLLHRIKRIMEMKTKNLNYSQRFLAILIILTGLVSIAWLNPSRKSDKKDNTAITDTIPAPPLPPSPAAAPAPAAFATPSAPPAPVKADVPAAPAPPAAPDMLTVPVPMTPAAPVAPATPVKWSAMPLPPTPPVAPYAFGYVYDFSSDTTTPRSSRKIIVTDEKGNKTEYNSIDEMGPEDRARMEESYKRMQAAQEARSKARHMWNDADIEKQLKSAKEAYNNINWNEIEKAYKTGFKAVDWEKMQQQMEAGMKAVDWDKLSPELSKQIKEQMKSIDWKKMSDDVKKSMKQQDWDKMKKDIQESMKNMDWDKIKKEMRESRIRGGDDVYHYYENIDVDVKTDTQFTSARARSRAEIERSRVNQERTLARNRQMQERDLERTRLSQERALAASRERHVSAEVQLAERRERNADLQKRNEELRAELAARQKELQEKTAQQNKNWNTFFNGLESDKLISRKDGFDIQKKGKELYINGKKQSDDVLKKYEQYLKYDNVTIRKRQDNLHISSGNTENQ